MTRQSQPTRLYGATFLTRPRWRTTSERRARRSPFQWGPIGTEPHAAWSLSLLGVINGPLSWTRIVLVGHMDDATNEVQGYSLKRRWW